MPRAGSTIRETSSSRRVDRGERGTRIRWVHGTDTLYVEFRAIDVAETLDLDENTRIDVDAQGNVCAITLEHASERTDLPAPDYREVAA